MIPKDKNIKIEIEAIYKAFEQNNVLNGICLSIGKGQSLVIIGPSSAGKTVLIKTIIGLFKPDRGRILIDGVDTVNIPSSARLSLMKKCGFLFQKSGLFDSLTVQENIIFLAERIYNLSKTDKEELAVDKLAAVKLPANILNLYPSELSGGMQKRVGIARAICVNPEILFFDDPTGGLDPILTNSITELIINIKKEYNPTIITITHNMKVAYKIADEVALMHNGEILWKGLKEEMITLTNPYLYQFINGLTAGKMQLDSMLTINDSSKQNVRLTDDRN